MQRFIFRNFLLALFLPVLFAACVTNQSSVQTTTKSSHLVTKSAKFNLGYTDSVVLLHGLSRTSSAMDKMASELSIAGYRVCNINYPSRHFKVQKLAIDFVFPKIKECQAQNTGSIHFVTHSMGGIIVRALTPQLSALPVGRLVMLSPPNQGSELVDMFGGSLLGYLLNGPAGSELGTKDEDLPQTIPKPKMPFGVIAATASNSMMSWLIEGDDDGKVSIEKMQLEGMEDFVKVKTTHSVMMWNRDVIEQTLHFIQYEKFYE